MDVLNTMTTKGQSGWQAARTAAQKAGGKSTSPLANLSFNFANPFAKPPPGRLEQIGARLAELGEAIFEIGEAVGATMAMYGPLAAQRLGWAEVPKQKRTAPRVAAGVVIGAGAMYFLEPKHGSERRGQLLRLVGNASSQPNGAAAPPPDSAAAQT